MVSSTKSLPAAMQFSPLLKKTLPSAFFTAYMPSLWDSIVVIIYHYHYHLFHDSSQPASHRFETVLLFLVKNRCNWWFPRSLEIALAHPLIIWILIIIFIYLYLSLIMIILFDLFHVAISKEDERGLATKLEGTLLQVGLGARPADDRFWLSWLF